MYSRLLSNKRSLAFSSLFSQTTQPRFATVDRSTKMSNRRSARLSTGRLQAEEEHNVKVDNGKLQNESLPAPKTTVKLSRSKKAVAGQTTDGQTAPKTQRVAKRKAVKDEAVINGGEVPQTPKKKSKTSASKAPITPSAGAVVASKDSAPKTTPRPRRVEPHATNAPLQTPGGSRVIKKYPSDLLEMSNSQAFRADFATTENLLERACEHLCSVDPKLKVVIDKHHCKLFSPEGLQEVVDPFVALTSSIISQQVSGAAAASIKNKFIGLFPPSALPKDNHFPSPSEVAAADIDFLRTAGLSQRKAEYIQGLAEKFASGELSAPMLVEASDEELLEKLIAVRGLGRWSVEMFACFALKRTDIFSTGDLGVQRGMAAYIGKDVSKLKAKGGGKWKYMSEQDMLEIANRFVPYRSLFMWYMWRIEDVNLIAIEGN